MVADPLLLKAGSWLAIAGGVLLVLTVLAFVMGWGVRFRLVGVSSFTLLLSVSCWAFAVSYSPPVRIEGAVRVPIVFDNGEALVVAQAPAKMPMSAVTPTLEQLAGNLRGAGRSSRTVQVRLRALQPDGDGRSRPVILGEIVRDFRQAPPR